KEAVSLAWLTNLPTPNTTNTTALAARISHDKNGFAAQWSPRKESRLIFGSRRSTGGVTRLRRPLPRRSNTRRRLPRHRLLRVPARVEGIWSRRVGLTRCCRRRESHD